MRTSTFAVAVAWLVNSVNKRNRIDQMIRGLVAICAAIMLFSGTNALAADNSSKHFDIKARPLADALMEFGVQSGLTVAAPTTLTDGKRSAPVRGDLSPIDALGQMLAGSGLTFTRTIDGTIAIQTASGGNPVPTSTVVSSLERDLTESPAKLEEIVVTAQKREERLIDVPISIAAISGEELARRGVTSILDLPFVTPSLAITDNPGGRSFSIRGISNFVGSTSPLVGVYLDEADITSSGAGTNDPSSVYDLERIEVLRGPQGTLYGEGSAGGTIRFITRNPDLEHFDASSDITASFTEDGAPSQRINMMLNMPVIADQFALRVVGTFGHDGGWIDQPAANLKDINPQNVAEVRVKGLWQPVEQLKVNLMADIFRSDHPPGVGEDANGNYTQVFNLTTVPQRVIDHDFFNLTVTYDFSGAQLLNTATYLENTSNFLNQGIVLQYNPPPPPPSTPLEAYTANLGDEHIWVDELRLTSVGSKRWDWTLGAFFRHDENTGDNTFSFGVPGPLPPPSVSTSDALSRSWSLFGQMSYRLTDRLTLGVGVRSFQDHQESTNSSIAPISLAAGFHSVDPRFYAQYKVTDHINIYASAAKGFRSGGFNGPDQPTFGPEDVWTYELGSKMALLEDRLSLNTALFYSNYTNYQAIGVFDTTTGDSVIANSGAARIKGVEWDFSWLPLERWRVGFNGDYLNTEFTKIDGLDTAQAVGDALNFIPRYQIGVSGEHDVNWGTKPGFLRLDYSRQGPEIYRIRNIGPWFYSESDTIDLLNFKAYLSWNKNLGISVFAHNLLNDRGYLNPDYLEGLANRPRPRTYGVEFNMTFD